jgi:CRP-like cAMP-binding protein
LPTSPSVEHARLIRKLETITKLTEAERTVLAELPLRFRSVADNSDILQEGDRSTECSLLVEGFAARYKVLGEGQRQIFSLHIPGDILDLQLLHLEVMDHSVRALAPCRVGYIPHQAIHAMIAAYPRIGAALWRDTLVDAAVFREWLAGVGRRSAYQRIAHLLCELYLRLLSVGLADAWSFELPVTQIELSDALGLSAVHVNRILQDLRRDGLIATRGAKTAIRDWARLQSAADFDPGYLHLRNAV